MAGGEPLQPEREVGTRRDGVDRVEREIAVKLRHAQPALVRPLEHGTLPAEAHEPAGAWGSRVGWRGQRTTVHGCGVHVQGAGM